MRTPTKHSVKMMNFGALIHVTWKTPSISWFTSISVAKWRISSVSEIINSFFLVCMSLPCAWISATSINCHLRGKPQGGGWRECHLAELRMLLWSGVTFKGNLGICDLYNARDCVSVMKNPGQKSWLMDIYILTGFSYKQARDELQSPEVFPFSPVFLF